MLTPINIIPRNDEGEMFCSNVKKLQESLNYVKMNDRYKHTNVFKKGDIPELFDTILDQLHIKHGTVERLELSAFKRKTGYIFRNTKEPYYRIIIHIGDNEVYTVRNDTDDYQIALQDGFGVLLGPVQTMSTVLMVHSEPIRTRVQDNLQHMIPKIRPRDYFRTNIVIDFTIDYDMLRNDES